ncbi:MAG: hypothetical protein NTW04_04750, partial [Elusimicrobia bacterium]|nr:hypothetical protein [Elusimicrobiota bacterium]
MPNSAFAQNVSPGWQGFTFASQKLDLSIENGIIRFYGYLEQSLPYLSGKEWRVEFMKGLTKCLTTKEAIGYYEAWGLLVRENKTPLIYASELTKNLANELEVNPSKQVRILMKFMGEEKALAEKIA